MKLKLRKCQQLIHKQKQKISLLQNKVKNYNSGNDEHDEQLLTKFKSNSIVQMQLRFSHLKRKGWRFKEMEKSFALSLYYNSPKAYTFMRKFLCLPTIRSLRKWLQLLDVSCGLNENVLEVLNTKFIDAEPKHKLVSIIIDEMSIKSFISYNSQNYQFHGFEDFGNDGIVDLKNNKYCNQALVVMIKSFNNALETGN